MPTHECLGPDDCENLQDRRKPAIQLDKEPAIIVRGPDATMQPTPQDNQLMPKHRVLSFRPQLRLEWRCHDSQNETEQPNHSGSLGDSITSSTRIGFSVHTSRVHLLKPSSTGTITGACHFFVRLKPKLFPNRDGLSRFLDRFDMLVRARYAGALWMTKQQNCRHAPLLRHSSGEYHNGGAGTSI